ESAFARGTNTEDQAKARAEFARAAALYAQIQARNPALCLNEGNAQLLAGVVPQAILAYQRGLRLAPNDARLRENLAYARQRVAYPGERGRPPPSAWPPWLPRPSIELLVALAAVVYLLACVVFTPWPMLRQVGGRFRACLLLGIAIAISGVAYLKLAGNDAEDRHPLVG